MKKAIYISSIFILFISISFAQKTSSESAEKAFNEANKKVKQQQYEKAIALYTQAIEAKNTFKEAYKNRGRVFMVSREYEKAHDDFNKAINIDSTDADLYSFRGFAKAEIAHSTNDSTFFSLALKDIKHAIKLNPNYDESYLNLGIVYMWLENYEEALVSINQAIKRNPTNGKAYYDRGVLYQKMEDMKNACIDWQKAQSFDYPLVTKALLDSCN